MLPHNQINADRTRPSLRELEFRLLLVLRWHYHLSTSFLLGGAMNVQDLIRARRQVFSIPEEMTVHDTARYLREHRVRAVGVVDAARRLVGAVSQSDISDKVAAENKCPA